MNSHYYGLILAGGRGTRFWPRSRKRSAKQVLNVVGESSLIQATVERLAPLIPPERQWILTNDHLRDTILKQLPDVPARQVLAEPAQRNTAPAIGLAAQILQSVDPDAVMGVFPSDHVVGKPAVYRKVIKAAFRGAAAGNLMVVGIKPRWPETGYGYIEFPEGIESGASGPAPVLRFHEKPQLPKAEQYVAAGNFYWNSGMFFWRASVLLEQLRQHLPKTATILASLPQFGKRAFASALEQSFSLCENISIDYAVLEKAANVAGVAAPDFAWNDVGSWNAVYELLPRDKCGNVAPADSVCLDAHDNFVDARGKVVALLGVKDLIVVDTPDALLVAGREHAQRVGEILKTLESRNRHDLL
jgi:mannose-1-phosphate guanylyltransferase